MKIVIPGGSGHLGRLVARDFLADGHEVVVLSREGSRGTVGRVVAWDGRSLGSWVDELEGADLVLNLAGRSVNCRYTASNLKAMMDSRVESTRAVGQAIAGASAPPKVWMQMSTATIYAHRFDAPNDEVTGIIGGNEPDVPRYWEYSVRIARNWERAMDDAALPSTRKVALRTALVMSSDPGGALDVLLALTKLGFGGPAAGGHQYVSWIHDVDFVNAIRFVLDRPQLTGAVNVCAPSPVSHREFMRALRKACGITVGLPATKWMLRAGSWALRTDSELILKSRRVTPGRLLAAGFEFAFPDWPRAAEDLVSASRRPNQRSNRTRRVDDEVRAGYRTSSDA